MHFKKIIGNKVYLSPRCIDDAEKYTEWLNDYDIAKYVNQNIKILSVNDEKEYLERKNVDSYNLAIIDKANDELIGSIGLMNISNVNRTAELGVFIGDKNHLSHGYGSEAIMLMLDFGFNQLNLNNINLATYDFNERAIRAYEKCGFKRYGIWEKSHYYEGKYHDTIFMNILKEDFNSIKKIHI